MIMSCDISWRRIQGILWPLSLFLAGWLLWIVMASFTFLLITSIKHVKVMCKWKTCMLHGCIYICVLGRAKNVSCLQIYVEISGVALKKYFDRVDLEKNSCFIIVMWRSLWNIWKFLPVSSKLLMKIWCFETSFPWNIPSVLWVVHEFFRYNFPATPLPHPLVNIYTMQ